MVYVYDAAEDTFKKLPDMPVGTPSQVHNAELALRLIDQGDNTDCPFTLAKSANVGHLK